MYFIKTDSQIAEKTTAETVKPAKIAIPPRFGVGSVCEVRLLGSATRPLYLETLAIVGVEKQVIRKAVRKAPNIIVQKGNPASIEIKFKPETLID